MCDAIIAVGDHTADEMHFLGDHFDHHHIDLVYNGIPHLDISFGAEIKSRQMLSKYASRLLGFEPDVLMTHVTRPVISKGIWRDLKVCHELDARLAGEGRTGVLFVLTTAGGTRRPQDVSSMETEYGWPRHHRAGYPDLVGPEVDFDFMIEQFNARHRSIQVVLVNQFGWSRELVGERVPEGMTFADFRRGTEVEFGMAVYEPFGISPLEPLGAGAICVISNVCGCMGFVNEVMRGQPTDNVIVADFTRLQRDPSIDDLMNMTTAERDEIEKREAASVADQLFRRLPRNDADRKSLLESGQKLVKQLGWDAVLETKLIPMLTRVMKDADAETHRELRLNKPAVV